jgi:hypothetical protein
MANFVAFKADAVRELAAQCLSLAQKHGAAIPLVLGHSLLGAAFVVSGDFAEGQAQLHHANSLYDPAEHSQPLSTRFGLDFTVFLAFRASAHWTLGRPEAARTDVERALRDARKIGRVPSLMGALQLTGSMQLRLGAIAAAKAQADELVALAEEKAAPALGSRDGGPKLRACLARRSLKG